MSTLQRKSIVALVVAISAGIISQLLADKPNLLPRTRGQNSDTIVFFALAESGQINVQLATAQALLEKQPSLNVHFASFAAIEPKVQRASAFARQRNPSAQDITFHLLPDPDRGAAVERGIGNCSGALECYAHPRGARGAALLATQMELCLWPWTGEEHLALFERSIEIVEDLDPALVVVDYAFRPPVDAMDHLNRHYALITPLALADIFAVGQPWGAALWKYPTWGTGFSFPVPWRDIPENVYMNFRLLYNLVMHPHSAATVKFLKDRKIGSHPLSLKPEIPFISQTLPGASIPVDVVPELVTSAGSMFLDSAPAIEQDSELAAWVQRAPTVVVNLGSLAMYSEKRACLMAEAIEGVCAGSSVQVLWKMAPAVPFGDVYTAPLKQYLAQDRVRIMEWLTIDTLPLLMLENATLSVHHGGSSSYNEAVAAGVPQVVMPLWEDHYNFAQLTEDLGLGLFATRDTAPEWTVKGISDPVLRLLDGSDASARIQARAKEVGDLAQKTPGRYVAAAELLRLMALDMSEGKETP